MSRRSNLIGFGCCELLILGAVALVAGRAADATKIQAEANVAAAKSTTAANKAAPQTSPYVDLAAPLRAAREKEVKIRKALDKEITIDFKQTPLNDAVKLIGKQCGIPIIIDVASLEEEGIEIDEPVSLKLDKPLPAKTAFNMLLEPLGLTWLVESETLTVAVDAGEGGPYKLRMYNVKRLLDAGYDTTMLSEVVQQESRGPWFDIDGIGGTVSELADSLIIQHQEYVHNQIKLLLGLLHRVATGPEKSGMALLVSTADLKVYKTLSRKVTVDFRDTPLNDIADFLSDKIGINVLLDETALAEEGIDLDEPITFQLKDVTLHSALKQMLEPLGMTYVIEDGVLKITPEIWAEEKLSGAIVNVRDFAEANYDSEALIKLIHSVTSGPWFDIDGIGGTVRPTIPGTMIVWQTLPNLQETAFFLEELRTTLKQNSPNGQLPRSSADPGGASGLILKYYHITSLPIEDVRDAIPKFVAPDTWKSGGGTGDLAMVESMIVVRHTRDVHRQIERFLQKLREKATYKGFGGAYGYGGGSGFFQVD